jgi:acyl carrier protein
MTKDEVETTIVRSLHEMFGIDPASITPDTDLYAQLGIDSIDAVDLVLKLQTIVGKRLAPESFKSVRTVRDLVDAIAVTEG